MALSLSEAYLGLCAVLVLLLPAGLLLIRLGERALGRAVHLTWVERGLLAFYLVGGLLYVVASVPLPIFGSYLIAAVIVGGILGVLYLRFVVHSSPLGGSARSDFRWDVVALGAGTLALLAFELVPVWQHPLPNAWDGSVASLWVNLTVSQHTLPWTLQPYAAAGVTYPQGQTVWLALPVLLWNWPVVSTPVLVPPLFLALSVPAAYCWGRRLGGVETRSGRTCGLLFAAFFGVVASWPRLYVGGSYDFVMGLPLFLVFLGGAREFVSLRSRPWSEVVLAGAAVGLLASLSLPAAEAFMVLLFGFALVEHRAHAPAVRGWLARLLAIVGVVVLFLVRSVAGTLVWFGYPSHVLAQTGATQQTPPPFWSPLGGSLLQQELDPFVPWKWRLSPFPAVSLMLQVLLVAGIVLAAWALLRAPARLVRLFPARLLSTLVGTSAILFLLTAVLVTSQAPGPAFTFLGAITNFDENSYLMFIGLSALAALPLVAVAEFLMSPADHEPERPGSAQETGSVPGRDGSARGPSIGRPPHARPRTVRVVLVVVLLVPLVVGTTATAVSGPSFLKNGVNGWSQVSPGDLDVLEWSSEHLPSCSSVFVAPGSVGQFLPEYAHVHLVYQMTPSPWNGSYYEVFRALSSGVYNASTRLALDLLDVTQVFVSGPTTPHFAALDPAPLRNSTDFRLLTESGDASIFEFIAGSAAASCGAT